MIMKIPDEIFEWWKAGLKSGKNNKTARRDAVLIWNEQNPDDQLTPAEVGIVCRVGDSTDDHADGPPILIATELTKAELIGWGKTEHGIDVPKSCKKKKQVVQYLVSQLAKDPEAATDAE